MQLHDILELHLQENKDTQDSDKSFQKMEIVVSLDMNYGHGVSQIYLSNSEIAHRLLNVFAGNTGTLESNPIFRRH